VNGKKVTFQATGPLFRLLLRPAAPLVTKRLLVTKSYEVTFYISVNETHKTALQRLVRI
jgi:hypothetical protein